MKTQNFSRQVRIKSAIVIVVLFSLPTIFNACGDVKLIPTPAASYIDEGSQDTPYTKPALAVRGAMCLMCHAQVHGDVVTDFGFGNPFFLTGERYTMRADAWSSAIVTGKLIVPAASTKSNDSSAPTIKQAIQSVGFQSGVSERQEVFIGSPNEEVITNLTHLPGSTLLMTEWDITAFGIGPTSFIRGLLAQQGPLGDFYFTNPLNSQLWCEGDIILLGPVHFKNLNLKTSAQGCRIYTKNTVFITGPVSYVNSPAEANLQISSSRAIFMGIRDVEIRMLANHAAGLRDAPTAQAETTAASKIYEDRDKIGSALVEDTGPFTVGTCAGRRAGTWRYAQPNLEIKYLDTQLPVATADLASCSIGSAAWAGSTPDGMALRKTIDYHGLVLNAPRVHGRYFGTFTGLVIGEDVIFAIDKFKFQFDPTFDKLTVLPLLKGRILRVTDN